MANFSDAPLIETQRRFVSRSDDTIATFTASRGAFFWTTAKQKTLCRIHMFGPSPGLWISVVMRAYRRGSRELIPAGRPHAAAEPGSRLRHAQGPATVLKFQTTRKILPCGRGCVFSGPAGSVLSTSAAAAGASRTLKNVSISGEIDVNRI
jgi:hypothetical protein